MNTLAAVMLAYQLVCPTDGDKCKWVITWAKPDTTVVHTWQAESQNHEQWRKCVGQYSTWGVEAKPIYISTVANSMFVIECPKEPNDFPSQTYKKPVVQSPYLKKNANPKQSPSSGSSKTL